jgi:hypothetical protein
MHAVWCARVLESVRARISAPVTHVSGGPRISEGSWCSNCKIGEKFKQLECNDVVEVELIVEAYDEPGIWVLSCSASPGSSPDGKHVRSLPLHGHQLVDFISTTTCTEAS